MSGAVAGSWAVLALLGLLASPCASGQDVLRGSDDAPSVIVTSSSHAFVAPLNKHTFTGNVLTGDLVRDWIVLFCVDWFTPCELVQLPYKAQGEKHHSALNSGTLIRDNVRFATVDCAVDKVLCNEQSVETYPTVAHYRGGNLTAAWSGGSSRDGPRLAKWLEQELASSSEPEEPSPLLTLQERRMIMRALGSLVAGIAMFVWAVGHGADLWELWRARGREPSHKSVAKAADKPREHGLVQRLPREWATERGSLEL